MSHFWVLFDEMFFCEMFATFSSRLLREGV